MINNVNRVVLPTLGAVMPPEASRIKFWVAKVGANANGAPEAHSPRLPYKSGRDYIDRKLGAIAESHGGSVVKQANNKNEYEDEQIWTQDKVTGQIAGQLSRTFAEDLREGSKVI